MQLNVKLKSPDGILPTRANPTDAGLDLYVPVNSEEAFAPYEKRTVDTYVQVAIPEGYVGLLFARSSLQKEGLMLANSVGVIDAGYRGTLKVVLINTGEGTPVLLAGERFAQLVLVPVITPLPTLVNCSEEEWLNTDRGAGGFGSTGKN